MFLLVAFTSESFSDIDVKIISWRCLDADAAAIVMNIRGSVSHTWVGTWDKDNKRQWLWKLPCLDGFFGLNCRRPICLWDADWGTRVLVCFKHPFFPMWWSTWPFLRFIWWPNCQDITFAYIVMSSRSIRLAPMVPRVRVQVGMQRRRLAKWRRSQKAGKTGGRSTCSKFPRGMDRPWFRTCA